MGRVFVFTIVLFQGILGNLVVDLPDGKVRGTNINTPSGKTFYAWRGIPYAKPPVGELRFMPPVKADAWDGILDASKGSPACFSFTTVPEFPSPLYGNSEDCLYVNIYSPVAVNLNLKNGNSTFPVMVWIYGGGFAAGYSDFSFFDPTPFLEENVIIVSFNYRLGTLGFLTTEDDVILGNAGLKDQNLALQWVQRNIAFFGGSPQDVTVFGESAGGSSVGYHIVSPMSRNLFRRAIMESGCAITVMASSATRFFSIALANQIDSSITNTTASETIKKVLQAVPAELLVNLTYGNTIGPVIEINSNQSFITVPLYEVIKSGNITQIPVIIGYNSEESLITARDDDLFLQQATLYDSDKQLLAPNNIPLKANISTTIIGDEIHKHYLGKNGLFANNLAKLLQWYSQNMVVRSLTKQAILQSNFSPVYMYQFSFYGSTSKRNPIIPGAGKVGHWDEVGYLFNISTTPIETMADFVTRRRLVKLWTNFAKTSNPTPDDDSSELLQNVKWEPITVDNITYLDIDVNLQTKPSTKMHETIFWDYLWSTYAMHPYNTY